MADLKVTRDSLRDLSLWLYEMALRAQLVGAPSMQVQPSLFVDLSQTIFRAVLDMESTGAGAPPPPPGGNGMPSPTGGFDAGAALKAFGDSVEAKAAEIQRKAWEDMQRRFEEQSRAGTQPTVSG